MEDARKRPGSEAAEDEGSAAKKHRDLAVEKVENDDVKTMISKANGGALEELVKLVNKDWPIVPTAGAAAVTFVENPYSSSWVFQALPSSYVTINLNEESCGPAFSDSVSTVMASVDLCGGLYGIAKEVLGLESEKWLMEEVEEVSGLYGLAKEVIGLESLKLVMAEEEEASGFGGACSETKELARSGWAEVGVEMDWDDAALARFIGEDGDLL
ncbi:hypothetical protein D8674_014245 [Pyrus ussuriensis x Pyrus communis]|uniref:Uncharacterized protein n=1 Tax=Pyrus ussuriensis x Pyrus communis TaxID=2448454 RepID=A0A5N5GS05_9ROSA|nr:hypothetical protein D8674_014245 [Pyrus ussuriensis x Pyrus communis]